MAPPVPVRDFSELVKALRDGGVELREDPNRKAMDILTGVADLPAPLHVRWEAVFPFVQIIQPILDGVPAERVGDLEAAVARLNNLSMVPGLGIDHQTSTVYFRLTTPVLVDGVRLDLFQALSHGAVTNALQFRPSLNKVLQGAKGEDVLALLKEAPGN
jgi:hypothetical protein